MSWLLLFIVFDISNGGMKLKMQTTKAFNTEAACNAAGQSFAIDYKDPNLRSMSICIPKSAYDE